MKHLAKRILCAVLACAMMFTATACGGDDSSTAQGNGETIELTFWYANSVDDYVQGAVERFNSTVGAEKGIHVTAENQGAYTDVDQKLQASYLAGTAPDMTVLEIASVGLFGDGGMLQSLDELAAGESDETFDLDDFHEGLLYNCYVNDTLYSVPFLRSTSLLYLNTTMLEQAGVDPASITTWDSFAEACEKVHRETGKYGVSYPINYWYTEAFMLTNGGFPISDDGKTCTVDNEVSRAVNSYWMDLMDKGRAHVYAYAEADKMTSDIINQDTAMWFSSTGGLTSYIEVAQENGFELQTAFIPRGTQQGTTTGGCNIAMVAGMDEERQAACWEFMKFMSSVDETVEACIATGYVATRKSALENEKMKQWNEQYPQYEVALNQLSVAKGRPNNPGYTEFQVEITNAIAEITVNRADEDATQAALERKGNELFNE